LRNRGAAFLSEFKVGLIGSGETDDEYVFKGLAKTRECRPKRGSMEATTQST
jgi:hypothetical protein